MATNNQYFNKLRQLALRVASELAFDREQKILAKEWRQPQIVISRKEVKSENYQEIIQQKQDMPIVNLIPELPAEITDGIDAQLKDAFVESVGLAQQYLQHGQINSEQYENSVTALRNTFTTPALIDANQQQVAAAHQAGELENLISNDSIHDQAKAVIMDYIPAPKPQAANTSQNDDEHDLQNYYLLSISMTYGRELYNLNNSKDIMDQGFTDLFRALINGPFNQLSINLMQSAVITLSNHPNQLNNELNSSNNTAVEQELQAAQSQRPIWTR